MQLPEPRIENVPAGHVEHFTDPATEKDPAEQDPGQEDVAPADPKHPALTATQTVEPGDELY